MKTSLQLSAIGLMACSLFLSTRLQATPVTGPWANAAGQGDGPILNGNTASPTVGDGSANSADGEMVHSPFSAITLDNSGDKIVFTGSVTLIGTVNSPLTSGTPRTQFRFGLFGDDGDGDQVEWVGYSMSNMHGNTGTPPGRWPASPSGTRRLIWPQAVKTHSRRCRATTRPPVFSTTIHTP